MYHRLDRQRRNSDGLARSLTRFAISIAVLEFTACCRQFPSRHDEDDTECNETCELEKDDGQQREVHSMIIGDLPAIPAPPSWHHQVAEMHVEAR
jgi:hypothetical protein